jgi:hypothetical protein
MSYKTQASIVDERPQVCDDFQKSNKIENYENLVIEDGKRAVKVKGIVFGIIYLILIWITIISIII